MIRLLAWPVAALATLAGGGAALAQDKLIARVGITTGGVTCCTFAGNVAEVPLTGTNVAATSYGDGARGMSGSAHAEQVVKRAQVSMIAPSSSLAGVPAAEFGLILQGSINGIPFLGTGPLFDATASATDFDRVFPVRTRFATVGVFFDRSVSATLIPDAGVVQSYVTAFAAAAGVVDPTAVLSLRLGSVLVEGSMNVSVVDRTNNANNMLFTVYSQRTIDYWVETTLDRIANGDFDANMNEGAVTGTNIATFDETGDHFFEYMVVHPVTDPLIASAAYNAQLPVWLRAGRTYDFSVGVSCRAALVDAARFFAGSGGSCDADRSGYWGGVVAALDEDGNPASIPDLPSASGYNYALASPIIPKPPVNPIPEPATWTLLIAGFGMIGSALRNRRGLVGDTLRRRRVAEGAAAA